MYKNSFLYSCKKTIHPIFTKINRVRPTVRGNKLTKFELNLMYRLDAIVFTHIHTHIYTHTHTYIHPPENSINEFMRPQNYKYVKISKWNFFMITTLSLHSTCTESKKSSKSYLSLKIVVL